MMDDSIMFSSQIIDDKVIVTARNKTTQVSKNLSGFHMVLLQKVS